MGLIQNLCRKCNVEADAFLHSLWDSSLVFPFWKEVIGKLGEWLEKTRTRISPTLSTRRSELPPGVFKAEISTKTDNSIAMFNDNK